MKTTQPTFPVEKTTFCVWVSCPVLAVCTLALLLMCSACAAPDKSSNLVDVVSRLDLEQRLPESTSPHSDLLSDGDAGKACSIGESKCSGDKVLVCVDGKWTIAALCAEGQVCEQGQCVCTPLCSGLECGDDGCGGSCGECELTAAECIDGTCSCLADCGCRQCGNDGCGSVCGACGANEVCITGQCLVQGSDCTDHDETSWDGCVAGISSEIQISQSWAGDQDSPVLLVTGSSMTALWNDESTEAGVQLRGRSIGKDGLFLSDEKALAGITPGDGEGATASIGYGDEFLIAFPDAYQRHPPYGGILTMRFSDKFEPQSEPTILFDGDGFAEWGLALGTPARFGEGPVVFPWTWIHPMWFGPPFLSIGLVTGVAWTGHESNTVIPLPAFVCSVPTLAWEWSPVVLAMEDGFELLWAATYDDCDTGASEEATGVYVRSFDSLLQEEGTARLLFQAEAGLYDLSASLLADTTRVLVWTSPPDLQQTGPVMLRRFDSDWIPLGEELVVSGSQEAEDPVIVVLPDGDGFAVAWVENSAESCLGQVYVQVFSSEGSPLALPTKANVFDPTVVGHLGMAVSAEGWFMLAWDTSPRTVRSEVTKYDKTR
jgi:hypothetical protein